MEIVDKWLKPFMMCKSDPNCLNVFELSILMDFIFFVHLIDPQNKPLMKPIFFKIT
jgi:hypothetical protein